MEYKTTTTKLSKNSREINSETVTIENDKEISKEIYIYIYTHIYIYIYIIYIYTYIYIYVAIRK